MVRFKVAVELNLSSETMPTYEFRCPDGTIIEKFFKISEVPQTIPSPNGDGDAVRMITGGAGLVFKGSGFYITDYGKDGKKDARDASAKAKSDSDKAAAKSETKSDSGGSDSKSEAKSSGASESSAKSDSKPAESKPAPKSDAPAATPKPPKTD